MITAWDLAVKMLEIFNTVIITTYQKKAKNTSKQNIEIFEF